MYKYFKTCLIVILVNGLYAQYGPTDPPDQLDGPYLKEHIPTKRLIPYEHVREADVIWSKRVWRRMDVREKINHPLYYPHDQILFPNLPEEEWNKSTKRWSLWTIIRYHIMNGDLTIFSPYGENDINKEILDGDLFKYPVKPKKESATYNNKLDSVYNERIEAYLSVKGMETQEKLYSAIDANGDGVPDDSVKLITDPSSGLNIEEVQYKTIQNNDWIISQHLVAYDIKEEWFFDKERSVMEVRIIGICPVVYEKVPTTTYSSAANNNNEGSGSLRQLFWLYFPHCRFVFNNYYAYNTKNDAQWVSYDDLFWKRQFSSYIYKESNVFDRKIEFYRLSIDALHESERISEEIRLIEHDMWNF